MELIKNVVIDMLLFSIFDSLVVFSYFLIDRKIRFNIKQFIFIVLGISLINSILSKVIPPVMFQVVFIMYIGLFLAYFYTVDIKKSMLSIFVITVIMLVIETFVAFILSVVFKIDLSIIDTSTEKFILCIPFRVIEFIFIYLYYKNRK